MVKPSPTATASFLLSAAGLILGIALPETQWLSPQRAQMLVIVALGFGVFGGIKYRLDVLYLRRKRNLVSFLIKERERAIQELLNAKITSDEELERWGQQYKAWHTEVLTRIKSALEDVDRHEFEYLGTFDMQSYAHAYNDSHQKYLTMLSVKLDRLSNLITRYS